MPPKIIDLVQGSSDWLDYRKGKIGASSAAAVLGKSRYKTKLQLWEDIVFGEKPKQKSFAMERGNQLEPIALGWLNENYGGGYRPQVLEHGAHDLIFASLDCYRDHGKVEIGEIKCPGAEDHLLALSGEIPEDYKIQMQHQMMVADVGEARYISFDGKTGVVLVLKRNESFIKELLGVELAFLASTVDLKPPEATDKDITVIEDSTLLQIAQRIVEIDRVTKELLKERDILKCEIVKEMVDSNVRIGNIRVQKRTPKGRIDYDKVVELQGVDIEKYRSAPGEAWHIWEGK